MKKPTREEVEKLKADWIEDPCWDIFDTEGFEAYAFELSEFQEEMEEKWHREYIEEKKRRAIKLGLSLDDYDKYDSAKNRYEGLEAESQNLLRYYLGMVVENMDRDVCGEIDTIVSSMIDAAVAKMRMEDLERKGKRDIAEALKDELEEEG